MNRWNQKPKKAPRPPGENLELPRRYLVKRADGAIVEQHRESRERVEQGLAGERVEVRLMGTHESVKHACERLGWNRPADKREAA